MVVGLAREDNFALVASLPFILIPFGRCGVHARNPEEGEEDVVSSCRVFCGEMDIVSNFC